MKSLKQIINRYIRSAAIVMALVILVVIAFAEILIEQGRVEDTAAGTFVRLEQIIEENENELKQVKEKYDKTCLHDAEAIAFLLQKDPEATNDTLKLKKYANLLELDEIHIFDETGTIVSGRPARLFPAQIRSITAIRFHPVSRWRFLRRCSRINPCSLCRMPARTPLRAKTCSIPPCGAQTAHSSCRWAKTRSL